MDNRESGLWVPASEHQSGAVYQQDEDEDEEEDAVPAPNGEQRGREEERQVAA